MQFTADERLQRHFEVAQDGDETGTRMPGECGEQVLKGQRAIHGNRINFMNEDVQRQHLGLVDQCK